MSDKKNNRKKPICKLIGTDGNIFSLMSRAKITLKNDGLKAEAEEMCERVTHSGSYDEALCIIQEYVTIQ